MRRGVERTQLYRGLTGIVSATLGALLLGGVAAAPEPATPPRPGHTASVKPVTLGGTEQWLLIRSRAEDAPVLLWLHGGPGSPTMPLAHRYDGLLPDHFTVVHWDQRGAGKSFDPALTPDALTIERFVSDLLELAGILQKRLGRRDLYLVGHSWGAVLGALAVARNPEPFHAFVGVSQPVNLQDAYALGYDALLQHALEADDQAALRELRAVGAPPYRQAEPLLVYGRWAFAAGGVLHGLDPEPLDAAAGASPFYTAQNAERAARGAALSTRALLPQLLRVDLFRSVTALEVPVYLFSGRFDLNSPGSLAERWLRGVAAPAKTFVWFEASAHFPMYEEPERFQRELIRILAEDRTVEEGEGTAP